MSKKKDDEYYTDTYSDEAPANEAVVEEQTLPLPEVPEGLDEAIFRQGWLDARKTAADAIERVNAFAHWHKTYFLGTQQQTESEHDQAQG